MTMTSASPNSPAADLRPYRGEREVVTLAEALDRLLYTGVSVEGRVAVGLADVELLFLDLRLLLGSVDTIWPDGRPPFQPMIPPEHTAQPLIPPPAPRTPQEAPARLRAAAAAPPARAPIPRPTNPGPQARHDRAVRDSASRDGSLFRALGAPAPPPSSSTADGLVRLVLTLVKLLHDVLERQAVRRMNAGALTDVQVEDIGAALLAQAQELERLRRQFGFSDGDLALNLAPPGSVT